MLAYSQEAPRGTDSSSSSIVAEGIDATPVWRFHGGWETKLWKCNIEMELKVKTLMDTV